MSTSMRSFYEDALSLGLISDVRVGVDTKPFPWDTLCYQSVIYLEFVDRSDRNCGIDRLYLTAFLSSPTGSQPYDHALGYSAGHGNDPDEKNLLLALHFALNNKVSCVYADADMLEAAASYEPRLSKLSQEARAAVGEGLPPSVLTAQKMLLSDLESGHDFWRTVWVPRIADLPAPGPAWFF